MVLGWVGGEGGLGVKKIKLCNYAACNAQFLNCIYMPHYIYMESILADGCMVVTCGEQGHRGETAYMQLYTGDDEEIKVQRYA